MKVRSQAATLVVERLHSAYLRHGVDTSQASFASEFKRLFGAEIAHLDEFFNRNGDLPLSDVLKLCDAVKVPPSEILSTINDQEHLQIYDYLGGSLVNVFLPPGLIWDRASVDSLFYYPLGDNEVVEGFSRGDFLVFTRMTLAPTVGRVYLLENNQEKMLRYCVASSNSVCRFSPDPQGADGSIIELAKPALTGDAATGFAAVTGALVWRISSGTPRATQSEAT
jgi:hypothetical protein